MITHEDGTILWSAVCNGAPIQELLARFAANAGLDLSWIFSPPRQAQTPLQTHDIAHTKPVVLYLPVTNQQQLIAAAAGQVGLLAHIENNNIAVYQPDSRLSAGQVLFAVPAHIAAWRRNHLTMAEISPNVPERQTNRQCPFRPRPALCQRRRHTGGNR